MQSISKQSTQRGLFQHMKLSDLCINDQINRPKHRQNIQIYHTWSTWSEPEPVAVVAPRRIRSGCDVEYGDEIVGDYWLALNKRNDRSTRRFLWWNVMCSEHLSMIRILVGCSVNITCLVFLDALLLGTDGEVHRGDTSVLSWKKYISQEWNVVLWICYAC